MLLIGLFILFNYGTFLLKYSNLIMDPRLPCLQHPRLHQPCHLSRLATLLSPPPAAPPPPLFPPATCSCSPVHRANVPHLHYSPSLSYSSPPRWCPFPSTFPRLPLAFQSTSPRLPLSSPSPPPCCYTFLRYYSKPHGDVGVEGASSAVGGRISLGSFGQRGDWRS